MNKTLHFSVILNENADFFFLSKTNHFDGYALKNFFKKLNFNRYSHRLFNNLSHVFFNLSHLIF